MNVCARVRLFIGVHTWLCSVLPRTDNDIMAASSAAANRLDCESEGVIDDDTVAFVATRREVKSGRFGLSMFTIC